MSEFDLRYNTINKIITIIVLLVFINSYVFLSSFILVIFIDVLFGIDLQSQLRIFLLLVVTYFLIGRHICLKWFEYKEEPLGG